MNSQFNHTTLSNETSDTDKTSLFDANGYEILFYNGSNASNFANIDLDSSKISVNKS